MAAKMDSSSRHYDERYEFDAPQQYFDFTNFEDDEKENSYFDDDGRSNSAQKLAISDNTAAAADSSMDAAPVTRSSRKGPLGDDGIFQEAPVRYSPRLAAIAKVVRSSSGNSRPVFKGKRRSLSAGAAVRRAREGGPLSVHEKQQIWNNPATTTKGVRLLPTRPVEFKFATDGRIKVTSAAPTADTDAADFAKTLRSTSQRSDCTKRGPTKVQPFKLSEARKQPQATDSKFVSLAELNMKFHSQTPQRFRTKSNAERGEEAASCQQQQGGGRHPLTRPHSPTLNTRTRSRPVNHPTREQIEDQEMQEAQQNKFKSKPLNPKIFEAPKQKLSVPKKGCTIPVPFAITESKKELEQRSNRGSMLSLLDDCLASVPHSGVPTCTRRTNTRLQPFSFDYRDQNMLKKKQDKIQQVIADEKAMADFHAHPMPAFEGGPKGLPSKKTAAATTPQPFDLNIDQRAEIKKQHQEQELVKCPPVRHQFHARPATVTKKDPFIPARSNKPLTEISGFELNTEKRSEQRQEYDMHLKRKEDLSIAQKMQIIEEQCLAENARIAEERKRVVHKARPMPEFPAPRMQPSDKVLTVPQTPCFATDSRLRSAGSKQKLNNTTFDTQN